MIKRIISNNFISLGYHIFIFLIILFTMGLFSGSVNNKFLAQFYSMGMDLFALFVIFLYLYAGLDSNQQILIFPIFYPLFWLE
jgi:hypothetical protein